MINASVEYVEHIATVSAVHGKRCQILSAEGALDFIRFSLYTTLLTQALSFCFLGN